MQSDCDTKIFNKLMEIINFLFSLGILWIFFLWVGQLFSAFVSCTPLLSRNMQSLEGGFKRVLSQYLFKYCRARFCCLSSRLLQKGAKGVFTYILSLNLHLLLFALYTEYRAPPLLWFQNTLQHPFNIFQSSLYIFASYMTTSIDNINI